MSMPVYIIVLLWIERPTSTCMSQITLYHEQTRRSLKNKMFFFGQISKTCAGNPMQTSRFFHVMERSSSTVLL